LTIFFTKIIVLYVCIAFIFCSIDVIKVHMKTSQLF
jgi:hypothetical protein